jgi:hypothetical protein
MKEGWTAHTLDICPVPKGTLVDVKHRDGEEFFSAYALGCYDSADKINWVCSDGCEGDIVAWRLSEKVHSNYVEDSSEAPIQIVDKIDNVNTVDNVNNPSHYTSHPSGIECIDVTRHMSFNLGNATKYIWRCDLKKDAIEDLRKAIFYLNDEIDLRLKLKEKA